MMHIPVNHQLRQLYRVVAGLTGLYAIVFGVLGFVASRDLAMFARSDVPWVLGLRANPAFALLSIVAGAVVVLATVIGRNADYVVNQTIGSVFLLVGLAMLTLLETDANILAFSMTNCIGVFVTGLLIGTAGLYAKVETSGRAA